MIRRCVCFLPESLPPSGFMLNRIADIFGLPAKIAHYKSGMVMKDRFWQELFVDVWRRIAILRRVRLRRGCILRQV
jgi:hypothetical protein